MLRITIRPTETPITINGEVWLVPWMFGKAFLRAHKDQWTTLQLEAALRQRNYSTAGVYGWGLRKRLEAQVYLTTYARWKANRRCRCMPKPEWLA